MVEFVIILPLIMLLILGVTELGRAMVQYNTLTKAVRDGARYASAYALLGSTGTVNVGSQLQTEVRNLVVYGNPAGMGTSVLNGFSTSQVNVVDVGGGEIRVDAAYPYQPALGPTIQTFGLGPSTSVVFTMQASVTMRAL